MSDPVLLLVLFVVGPASICITTLLGYLAFLHITKKYANQASNNIFDRLFEMLERKLPDIVESVLLTRKQPPETFKTNDLSKNIEQGHEMLSQLLKAFGADVSEDTSVKPNELRSRSNKKVLDLD